MAASKSGRPGGRRLSVTKYVDPQATGAIAVIRRSRTPTELVSMESNISSMEGNINP
jgi:hypothetical protein